MHQKMHFIGSVGDMTLKKINPQSRQSKRQKMVSLIYLSFGSMVFSCRTSSNIKVTNIID